MIIRSLTRVYNDPLIKNSIFLMMSNIFSLIIGFFFWIVVARYYTPQDIGSISVILSGTALISIICTMGFPTALVFYLPRDPKNANRMINSCMIVSIAASAILSLIWILRADIWAPKLEINKMYIMLFVIMSVIDATSTIMSGAFVAGRRSSFHMTKETVLNVVKIFPIVLLSGLGAMGILLSWTIGMISAMIVGFILLYKLWKYLPTLTIDPIIKSMLGMSTGNYVAGIIGYIPKSLLPIIIANLVSTEAAGYFFISMTIASVLNTVPQFIASSLLAESSKEDKLWNNVSKAIRFNICIIFPGLLLFMIFGKFLLNIFNHNYAEYALSTLIILSITSIPLLLNNTYNAVRNSQKRVMSVVYNNIGVAGITVILSILLVRVIGIEGAALAYLTANTVVAITVVYKTKNPIEFILRLYREFVADINMILENYNVKEHQKL